MARLEGVLNWHCAECGKEELRKGKRLKMTYCGYACRHAADKRAGRGFYNPAQNPAQRAPSRMVVQVCEQCGKEFKRYPSNDRKFCSYPCFLESGGPLRAGHAAIRAKLKYGSKKDANHKELITAMRALVPVYDMSSHGCGVPDGVAWCLNNTWQFFDIKNPKTAYGRRGLNEVQKKWLGNRKAGPVFLLYTVDEAIRFAKGEFDGLKFEVGNTDAVNL